MTYDSVIKGLYKDIVIYGARFPFKVVPPFDPLIHSTPARTKQRTVQWLRAPRAGEAITSTQDPLRAQREANPESSS